SDRPSERLEAPGQREPEALLFFEHIVDELIRMAGIEQEGAFREFQPRLADVQVAGGGHCRVAGAKQNLGELRALALGDGIRDQESLDRLVARRIGRRQADRHPPLRSLANLIRVKLLNRLANLLQYLG